MKIAIYFSEKLILIFVPLISASGSGIWTFTPPPLAGEGRGVGEVTINVLKRKDIRICMDGRGRGNTITKVFFDFNNLAVNKKFI